jgi:hypothetical protein
MGTSRGELDEQPNRFKFEQQQLQEEEGSLLPRKPQGGGAPTSCLDLFYSSSPPPPGALLAFLLPLCRAECPLFPISFFCFSTEEAGFWQNSFQKGISFGRVASFCLGP